MSSREGAVDPASHETVLQGWRGSPELLAHVVRVVERASTGGEVTTELLIDVEVREDHELFSSPTDFLTNVTPDALRHFRSISVVASGGAGRVSLVFGWTRPWWHPGKAQDWTSDARIDLQLTGPQPWRDHARAQILPALRRGWRAVHWKGLSAGLVALIFTVFLAFSSYAVAYLLGLRDPVLVAFVGGIAGLMIGAFLGSWVVPTLEVAAPRQSNLARTLKAIGTVMLSLALAGISKALFG